MFDIKVEAHSGTVQVKTTSNRGFTPEEIASRAVDKIIFISDSADPVIKLQAEVFKERMYYIIVASLKEAINSDRTTLYNLFKLKGHGEMAEILRTL
jgi:hypothetical protein|tara:strand:+ start:433 stop:723 length:291 start_codon:yes stop_codon:yes gene_type:complete